MQQKPERETSHRGVSRTACQSPIRRTLREDGVSEAVGAILLIAVIALGITAFTVVLLSQQAAPVLPSVTFNVTYGDNGSVAIRHQGGDMIPRDQLRIYIDNGIAVLGNEALTKGSKEDWTAWGIGDILVYDPPEPLPGASEVLMVYADRSGGEYLLHISEGWKGPIPTTTPTGTVTATPTATATATATLTPTPVPPVANFTANVTSGLAPLAVAFNDTSAGEPTSWSWDFENDGVVDSTEQNPTFTYTTVGTYTVSLTVTKAETSNTETKTGYIAVYNSSSPGLVGTYYPTREFTGTPVQRVDQRLRFADARAGEWYHYDSDEEDWPIITLNKTEQFSVVYEGYLLVPAEATYTFHLTSDDGSRLWIDAVDEGADPLIDNWDYHSPKEMNSSIHLSAGPHPIKVKMFENWNAAVLYLEWSSPAFERKPVDSFCQGPPPVSADFTATPQNGTAPLEVQFADTSTGGATAWAWDFGDENTSTLQNPEHTYAAAGTYTVSLTATNAGGSDAETKVGYVTVTELQPPTAAFSADVMTGTAPLAVLFTDASTNGPTSWSWTFGDGGTSTLQSPGHTYAAAGTYTVSLTAANAAGSDAETKTGYVTVTIPPPAADFSATPTSGIAPLAVQFTDISTSEPTSWSWTFGDGGTSTLQNPLHTYASAGTYTVTLTATNAGGSDAETKTDYITVEAAPIVHNINLYSQKASYFESGGYYQFEVGGSGGGSLNIAGNSVSLHPGDSVRLTLGSGTTGTINAGSTGVSSFPSSNIIVTINGAVVSSGTLSGINAWGTSFTGSTITVNVPAIMGDTTFTVDGSTIISGQDERQIIIYKIQPSTSGDLYCQTGSNVVNVKCGAESYQLIMPPQHTSTLHLSAEKMNGDPLNVNIGYWGDMGGSGTTPFEISRTQGNSVFTITIQAASGYTDDKGQWKTFKRWVLDGVNQGNGQTNLVVSVGDNSERTAVATYN